MEVLVKIAMVYACLTVAWSVYGLLDCVFGIEKYLTRKHKERASAKLREAYLDHVTNTMAKIADAEIAKIIIAKHMKNEKSKPKQQTCPHSCECYHRGKIGTRACLAKHWDERDPRLHPLLLQDTLEPVIPSACGAIKGDQLLADILTKARRRGWR
jgi:hypothetical protein